MMKRAMAVGAVALLSMFILAGCGEKAPQDPYAQVSLHTATYGPPVVSKGFKYKIVNPQIVDAEEHLVLVREGNVTAIIAGRSIADKIEGLDKSNITFNVVKKYSPYVHFKAEQIVSGQDSVFISAAGSIYYPRIVEAGKFNSKDHDEYDIDRLRWNDSAGLRKAVDKKFAVKGKLARVEEDGEEVWVLQGDRATLRISGDMDSATAMVLRQLANAGMPFEGGVTFEEVEEWTERRNNQIAGTVNVDYVKYLGKVFAG